MLIEIVGTSRSLLCGDAPQSSVAFCFQTYATHTPPQLLLWPCQCVQRRVVENHACLFVVFWRLSVKSKISLVGQCSMRRTLLRNALVALLIVAWASIMFSHWVLRSQRPRSERRGYRVGKVSNDHSSVVARALHNVPSMSPPDVAANSSTIFAVPVVTNAPACSYVVEHVFAMRNSWHVSLQLEYADRVINAPQGCDEVRLEKGTVEGNAVIRFDCSNTFLSRESTGRRSLLVVGDKLEARSAEQWRLECQSAANERQCKIFGVSSQFQPNAGELCVGKGAGGGTLEMVAREQCLTFKLTKRQATERVPMSPTTQPEIQLSLVLTSKPVARLSERELDARVRIFQEWGRQADMAATMDGVAQVLIGVCLENNDDSAFYLSRNVANVKFFADCEVHPELRLPTYRGLFRRASEMASASVSKENSFVGMANADIVMDLPGQVIPSLRAALRFRDVSSPLTSRHVLVTGRRWNCDEGNLKTLLHEWRVASMRALNTSHCERSRADRNSQVQRRRGISGACQLFADNAEDYFLMTMGALQVSSTIEGDKMLHWQSRAFASLQPVYRVSGSASLPMPPLVVGGIAFDNWIVAALATRNDTVVFDASAAIEALHFGAGDLMASHKTAASRFNSEVAHYCGGWAQGKVSGLSLCLLPDVRVDPFVVRVHQRGALVCGSQFCPIHPFQQNRQAGDAFDGPWLQKD